MWLSGYSASSLGFICFSFVLAPQGPWRVWTSRVRQRAGCSSRVIWASQHRSGCTCYSKSHSSWRVWHTALRLTCTTCTESVPSTASTCRIFTREFRTQPRTMTPLPVARSPCCVCLASSRTSRSRLAATTMSWRTLSGTLPARCPRMLTTASMTTSTPALTSSAHSLHSWSYPTPSTSSHLSSAITHLRTASVWKSDCCSPSPVLPITLHCCFTYPIRPLSDPC